MLLGKRLDKPGLVREPDSTKLKKDQSDGQAEKDKQPLEIEKMKATILEQIRLNQVTIISGETGCGKSTQVPQYIVKDAETKGQRCKILCTQPRRIACVSIAKRVAQEMGGVVGELVGYHISMDARIDTRSQIIFVTNGILLNYLTHNPSILTEYTHIIIDEVHERDIDSDFILILFKLFLSQFPELKLVLMSATINAELFARYFAREAIDKVAGMDADSLVAHLTSLVSEPTPKAEIKPALKSWADIDYDAEFEIKSVWQKAGTSKAEAPEFKPAIQPVQAAEEEQVPMATILEIDSRRKYQIKEVFLNELEKFENFNCPQIRKMGEFNFNKKRAVLVLEVVSVAVQLVEYLHCNERNIKFPNKKIENGGILVFLPGLNEITYFIQMLTEKLHPNVLGELEIIPLHSTIAQIYEQDVFSYKKNVRKVIVCTNIAESSLTIPDIIFVIDFCLSKEFKFDSKTQSQRLDLTWACKASCRQRTGRTGRVCDGMAFRMVSYDFFHKTLDNFTEAEMLRSPLDKVILKICVLHEEIEKKNDLLNSTVASSKKAEMSKVNDIFLSIANRVFRDPRAVLQIAIERPSFDQVDYAMNFLTSNGAFRYTDEARKVGKITFLGRIYSDLPCSLQVIKLLLYGHVFGCFEDTLTIGVMQMHPKSLWLPRTSKGSQMDYLQFYRRIEKLADSQFSDHIMYLNIFKDWHSQFGDDGDLSKLRGRKLRFNPVSKINPQYKQRDWYRDHNIRQSFMQEIMTNRHDIRRRLVKFIELEENPRIRPQMSELQREENYLKIKICVAGASLPYFALGIFRPNSKQKNEVNHIVNEMGLDPIHCVNLYELPLYKIMNTYNKTILEEADQALSEKYSSISDEEKISMWKNELVKNIQSRYGPIQKVMLQPRVAYVQFKPEASDLSIRSLLFDKNYRKGLTSTISAYSYEDQGMTSVAVECVPKNISNLNKGKREPLKMEASQLIAELHKEVSKDVEEISDVTYNFDPCYENMFSASSLIIESLSIARIITRARKDYRADVDGDEKLFVVYSDEIQANNKSFLAKTSTLMPSFPFLIELMILVFGSTVYLEASDKYERVTHIKLGSSDIPLTYWLSRNDIITVNKIRSSLKKYFEDQDGEKTVPSFIWEDMLRLLRSPRERFYQADQWFDYFVANLKVY